MVYIIIGVVLLLGYIFEWKIFFQRMGLTEDSRKLFKIIGIVLSALIILWGVSDVIISLAGR